MNWSDPLLNQSWIHSHEEDRGEEIVYRPSTFAFPPSRGRHGFSLRPDGTAVITGPNATDQRTAGAATWHAEDPNRLVVSGPGDNTQILEITSANPDKLVVKRAR